MYLQEVRTLVKHGIKSAYVAKEDNLNFYKGKLKVKEQIERNAAHGERFFVRFDEYQVDRAEDRLVKATLLKLQNVTGSTENQKEIRQLLSTFEMVEESTNYQKDFSRVVIDRNTKEIPHNKGGWLASEFSVMRACKFRRLAGGKSRNLQDVHGGNGTARHAARLCGISLNHSDSPIAAMMALAAPS